MDRTSLAKVAVIAVLVTCVVWFYASGRYEDVDPNELRLYVRDAGALGAVLFVLAYSFLQPFGINGLVFLLSAPLIWNPAEAFLLNWAGTVGTGIFSFAVGRFIAKDWVQKRLPERVRRFDERLHTRGFVTVLLLRLVFYTMPTLQYALGVSRVRMVPFLAGTVLGVAPFTLLATFLGIRINEWLDEHPLSSWPWAEIGPWIVLLVIVAAASGVLGVRRWKARTVD
ncbi:MAG: VTT domain-containing protein [Polyangiales bacterium]